MTTHKLLCMGDSLTEGYGIPAASSWPTLLQDMIGFEVINCGISGDTTGGMLARFNAALSKHNPTHVFIMGGTNDLWLDLAQNLILSNIMAMSRQARAANCQAVIGIPTACFFNDMDRLKNDIFLNEKQLALKVKQFQVYLRQAMKIDDLPIIDFGENMHADLFLPDGVHPNVKGNVRMANMAFEFLGILLNM